jgi:hypothetical protein
MTGAEAREQLKAIGCDFDEFADEFTDQDAIDTINEMREAEALAVDEGEYEEMRGEQF